MDVEAAMQAIDEAEGALRGGSFQRAVALATVASVVARRPFLPGEEGDWIRLQRSRLGYTLARGLECLAHASVETGESQAAVQYASEVVGMEPLRESGYLCLMRAHAAAGNRGQAIQVYDQCRRALSEQLGVDPSPETEATYLEILRA